MSDTESKDQLRVMVDGTIERIVKNDYFLNIWNEVKHVKPLDKCTDRELVQPFQALWDELPDAPHIQREPFNRVCDLAEVYCFGDFDNSGNLVSQDLPEPEVEDEETADEDDDESLFGN